MYKFLDSILNELKESVHECVCVTGTMESNLFLE